MTTLQFLSSLRGRDVQLWVEGDRLRCSAPPGVLTADLRSELTVRKPEILTVLREAERLAMGPRALVPLQSAGGRRPFYAVPGHNGDVFCYVKLARLLGGDRPFYGLQPPGLDGRTPLRSVPELAAHYVSEIQGVDPEGPYLIGGYCAGGSIAFEVARQLAEGGRPVSLLALFGSPFPTSYRMAARVVPAARYLLERLCQNYEALASRPFGAYGAYLKEKLRSRSEERRAEALSLKDPVLARRDQVGRATMAGVRRYTPSRFSGRIDHFLPCASWRNAGGRSDDWSSIATSVVEHVGPDGCNGDFMLREPHVLAITAILRLRLDELA